MLTLTQPVTNIVFDKKPTPPVKMTPAERKYFNELKLVAKEIEKILKSTLTSVTKAKGIKAMELLKRYSKTLEKWASKTVATMFYNVNKDNQKLWNKLSARMSRDLRKELSKPPQKTWFQKYMDDNVKLIQSMPLEAAAKVHELVKENVYKGMRSTELVDEIMRIGGIQKNRAKTIARTETSRYSTALTEMRAESIGANWYIWKAVGDFRTRKSHKNMNNVVINWSDPPSPEKLVGEKDYGDYHPGQIFNCRCYPEVVLDIDGINFPAKVYRKGRIETMKKDQFMKMAGQVRH